MEIQINSEVLFWLKVAGWLFIGGLATLVLAKIWQPEKKEPRWNSWEASVKKHQEEP